MNVLIEEGFKKIRYVWERVRHNEGHHPDKKFQLYQINQNNPFTKARNDTNNSFMHGRQVQEHGKLVGDR